ncbi:MAG: PD-(D/E)XK nuclease family protein [Saprospiraceae bacterium]
MKLIFGLQLDDHFHPRLNETEGGVHYCGPKGLLHLLETHLGLTGRPDDIDYLRIEQYRQALQQHLKKHPGVFYRQSFDADQFATATELLNRRDELLLAGWDFAADQSAPLRLRTLAGVEAVFRPTAETPDLDPGLADRFRKALETLGHRPHPFREVWLNEPIELLPGHFRHLFEKMADTAAKPPIRQLPFTEAPPPAASGTDLHAFQHRLTAKEHTKKTTLRCDGSLLLLRAKRAGDAAAFTAKMLRLNPELKPACLIPEKNRTLEVALIQEGMPSLGIQSASLARPTLQILKLVPAFLWEPIDPFKILEFVSLSIKPLEAGLATAIAHQVAQAPGLQGDGWHATINRYFEELENRAAAGAPVKVPEVRKQYSFWFERKRYPMERTVPKREVLAIFDYLRSWSLEAYEDGGSRNHSLIVLREQSKRIVELLQALPETELTYLELERIVRTIYEPAPVVFQEKEAGHLPFVMHPGAFIDSSEVVLWWNFIQNEPPHFFSKWYRSEYRYLSEKGLAIDTPELQNTRLLWQRNRPVLAARHRLILVLPETVHGEEALPHPLLGDLQAAFGQLDEIVFDIDSYAGQKHLARHYQLPARVPVGNRQLGTPKPFLYASNLGKPGDGHETLTSLETLFYYPYQWVFRHKIKLKKSSILSVVKDNTLKGNLAHRVFDKLMREDIHHIDRATLEKWMEVETGRLLAKEGAVLLMYGREPERVAFVNKLKFAAWSLITHIRDNGWKVKQTEMNLSGQFPPDGEGTEVRGIADLVLERGDELAVLDLKWRGAAYRERIIRNEEDLQLVFYARLLNANAWPHTAYFIIESGKLLARNNLAFKGATPIAPGDDPGATNERILARMSATWRWRMAQLAEGKIEIRCRQTLSEIEEAYANDGQGALMLDILEMKGGDARFDDYRTLINLLE